MMLTRNIKHPEPKLKRVIIATLRFIVLAAALMLLSVITVDTFDNVSFIVDPQYLRLQFWICVIFMIDVAVEFFLGSHNFRRMLTEAVFLLLCIPYINIIDYFDINVSGELIFVLRALPMLRAIYIVVGVTGRGYVDRVSDLFRAYITLFVVIVYFSSLMFYVEEHGVNTGVESYWSALWWTVMTLTTAGCYITEVTMVGKILSVILSGGGLILFPVFTVYVANAVSGSSDGNDTPVGDVKKGTRNTSEVGNNSNFAESNNPTEDNTESKWA